MTAGGTSSTEASTGIGSHAAPQFDEARVPLALRERSHWVCWEYVARDGKPTKCPIDPRTGRAGKINNSAIWGRFDETLIVRLSDGLYLGEHKTASKITSDYLPRAEDVQAGREVVACP